MINEYRTEEAGQAIIKEYEGLRLEAYTCPAGVWTIGWGHTGPEVEDGLEISLDEAQEYFEEDLLKFETGIRKYVMVEINQNQFDALVSLSYNIGIGAFKSSTLLRKLNAGDIQGAANQFLVWKYESKRVLPGLVRRRKSERELFLKNDGISQTAPTCKGCCKIHCPT